MTGRAVVPASGQAALAGLVDRICAFARVENRAVAAQLDSIGELFAYRLSRPMVRKG